MCFHAKPTGTHPLIATGPPTPAKHPKHPKTPLAAAAPSKFRKLRKNVQNQRHKFGFSGKVCPQERTESAWGREMCPSSTAAQKLAQKKNAGTKAQKAVLNRRVLTWFDALEPDGDFAVSHHGVDVPGGQPGHRGVVDLQQEFIRAELAAEQREAAVLRAAPQLQPRGPLLGPAEDTLVDSAGPVVLPLPQTLGHGSGLRRRREAGGKEKNHMSAAGEVGLGRRGASVAAAARRSVHDQRREPDVSMSARTHIHFTRPAAGSSGFALTEK